MNPAVDFYFSKTKRWLTELEQLRTLVLGCGLTEELKWGVPCYTLQGKNIVLIHAFKEYCALLFFKGALLSNANGLLVQQTENTQTTRQLRFTSLGEVVERESIVKASVAEAVEIEKAGLKGGLKQTAEYLISAEFQRRLDEAPALQRAFQALTPGRQRAYLLHFSAPKQATTREARVRKWMPQILNGKGLND